MEIRNIQKTGGSSYTLTLPKNWIKETNLSDKSKVAINAQESGTLVVQPLVIKKHKSHIIIDTSNMTKQMISREIIGYYISGIDELIIKAEKISYDSRIIIRETTRKLIGFEIFEEASNKILIKNIFDNKKFLVTENVEKIFSIILSMYQDVSTALKNNDRDLADNVIERDNEIDKLVIAILRQFNSLLENKISEEDLGLGVVDLSYYENISIQTERIADHIVKIAQIVRITKKENRHAVPNLLKRKIGQTLALLKTAGETVRKLDKSEAHRILDMQNSLTDNIYSDKNIVQKKSSIIIIEDSIGRIQGYICNIAEHTINYLNRN